MNPVLLKTSLETLRIKKACLPIGSLFAYLSKIITPGLEIGELRRTCVEFLWAHGCDTALRGFNGFPEDICVSVNNVAAHGVVNSGRLEAGDLLTIDVTTLRDGWYGDGAWTFAVGDVSPEARRLVRCAWQASRDGVHALKAGGYLSRVGEEVEAAAQRSGCAVLPYFVGHGIGRGIHEEPKVIHTRCTQLPVPVVPGMVVTVEPILSLGKTATHVLKDGWSQTTRDGSITAQYEHTVAVFSDRTELLTFEDQSILLLDFPPFV